MGKGSFCSGTTLPALMTTAKALFLYEHGELLFLIQEQNPNEVEKFSSTDSRDERNL